MGSEVSTLSVRMVLTFRHGVHPYFLGMYGAMLQRVYAVSLLCSCLY